MKKMSKIQFIDDIEKEGMELVHYSYDEKHQETKVIFQNKYVGMIIFYDKETSGKWEWHYYFDNRVRWIKEELWVDLANQTHLAERIIEELTFMKNWVASLKKRLQPIFEKYEMRELD